MINDDKIDVIIVEDEGALAQLHAGLVREFPCLRVAGIVSTLAEATQMIEQVKPKLLLLDNYLPDGEGISMLRTSVTVRENCSVIFITAASDMTTCSEAIRHGAFDYILKPVSLKRLSQSLENFIQFNEQQRQWKIVDQKNVDALYQLQARNLRQQSVGKGIEENTLVLVKNIFLRPETSNAMSVDEVMVLTGLSKTTTRRYLEYCVRIRFLEVELVYGKIGHPRRKYCRSHAG